MRVESRNVRSFGRGTLGLRLWRWMSLREIGDGDRGELRLEDFFGAGFPFWFPLWVGLSVSRFPFSFFLFFFF